MRALRITLIALTIAGVVSAQAPPGPSARSPLPLVQSVTFDVASAFEERWRVTVEPLRFDRFTIGLTGTYTTKFDGQWPPWPMPLYETGDPIPCSMGGYCGGPYGGDTPEYRAESFDLAARWYPAALSFGDTRQAVGVYLGEFIGYHRREITWRPYYWVGPPVPADTTILPPDSVVPMPYPEPQPQPGGTWTQSLHGWEPGAELGVRITAARHVIIEVGGWFKLATVDDPLATVRPGEVDARLVVAVGVGW